MLQSVQGLQWTKTTKQAISASSAAVQTQTGNTDTGNGGVAGTRLVELTSDTDCFVAIGPHGTTTAALTTSIYLPAKTPRVYSCDPGNDVAVIGTTGNLYISEGR